MLARTVAMPVVGSTAFSIIAMVPRARRVSPGMMASTEVSLSAIATLRSGRLRCGTDIVMYTGAIWLMVAMGTVSPERAKLPT